ncbi:hypothetical protein BGE01nite_13060 [Brevifollis gellanilyticus]|uniref:Uncharacterized protein n=1 Tax=Brevifollis gellanilyticus TaxID=748831 RepID=A0A512M5K6_9BACT|nr:hypothetical protein BGE01nite_13060 [Brevifollis gellanilyticus]
MSQAEDLAYRVLWDLFSEMTTLLARVRGCFGDFWLVGESGCNPIGMGLYVGGMKKGDLGGRPFD